MIRRILLHLLLTATLPTVSVVEAQQQTKISRIGLLSTGSASVFATRVDALKSGLRALGYIEGQNITIEYGWAEGQRDRVDALAAELVGRRVDVIVTPGTLGAVAAKKATLTIPIVFVGVGSPEKVGLVASFARPGGNATGLTQIAQELGPKRLELLMETFPNTRRVIYIGDADSPGSALSRQEVGAAAKSFAVEFNLSDYAALATLIMQLSRQKKEDLVLSTWLTARLTLLTGI